MATQPTWVEHADIVIPAVQYAIEILIWVIGASVAALCGVIGWVGRQFAKKFNQMDTKIDIMHAVMLQCDGCAAAAKEFKRRKTDLEGSE